MPNPSDYIFCPNCGNLVLREGHTCSIPPPSDPKKKPKKPKK